MVLFDSLFYPMYIFNGALFNTCCWASATSCSFLEPSDNETDSKNSFNSSNAKELLGIIRSKYASMPLPNGEVSLDGEALKGEGREEKANLLDELKEFLDSVSLAEGARKEQEVADAQQSVLNKAPLKIYIG